MEQSNLKQRFESLEAATAKRLELVNSSIRNERENNKGDKDKIDFLKGKRKTIMTSLNLVREKIKSGNLNYTDYNSIRDEYVNFQSGF
jgi:hypothetical protein